MSSNSPAALSSRGGFPELWLPPKCSPPLEWSRSRSRSNSRPRPSSRARPSSRPRPSSLLRSRSCSRPPPPPPAPPRPPSSLRPASPSIAEKLITLEYSCWNSSVSRSDWMMSWTCCRHDMIEAAGPMTLTKRCPATVSLSIKTLAPVSFRNRLTFSPAEPMSNPAICRQRHSRKTYSPGSLPKCSGPAGGGRAFSSSPSSMILIKISSSARRICLASSEKTPRTRSSVRGKWSPLLLKTNFEPVSC
mmetsp:Transcript_48142/g.122234  ORF Transcript_48142/g.122234 Transcript_48142/m.122234 type:complete len:247 (-) Transcript_48142:243-983(-)